jgi:anti-sigma-K factor RskA
MIDDDLQTQAALYALDALPDDEAAAFRARLAGNPELAKLVAEYEAAASAVAETAPPVAPPPRLRENILAAVAPKSAAIESSRIPWFPWALAAGFAFAAGALWMQGNQLRTENRAQLAEWADLNKELQSARTDLERRDKAMARAQSNLTQLKKVDAEKLAKIATLQLTIADLEKRNAIAEMQVATLTSKLDASYLASIAWDTSSQEGVLHVRRLPAAESGKDYQLWVIDPKYKVPVNAGIFKVQPDGSATVRFAPNQRISEASAFAITLEREGGVPKAEGPVMLSN